MEKDRSTNREAHRPLKLLHFSLRSLFIATAVVAADLAIVAEAGPPAVLGLVAALTVLALGIGGMLISEVLSKADLFQLIRGDRCSASLTACRGSRLAEKRRAERHLL